MAAPSARAPAQLPDEIIEDVLLRFPPEQPAHLLRAALVSKPWSRLIAGHGFRRRYRQRHREGSLVLGLVANLADTGGAARFVPTRCAFRTAGADDRPGFRAHDARHGRVLLNRMRAPPGHEAKEEDSALAVWDPISGEQRPLPLLLRRRYVRTWNAAVLCGASAGGGGACDHLDCHREPFRVVFVGIDAKQMFAHVYSSYSAAWSEATTADLAVAGAGHEQLDVASPGVLARDALYFLLHSGTRILRCDPASLEMSVLRLPQMRANVPRIVLMTLEDGALGFAQVALNCTLRLWSMTGDGVVWVMRRAIDLKAQFFIPRQLPALGLAAPPPCVVVAFAEGTSIIFLKTNDGHYSFDLKSDQVVKVDMSSGFYDIVPFVSFYTPVLRVAYTGEGPSGGASTS